MRVIVLTGGIATGKSTVLKHLSKLYGQSLQNYDCDAEVARILSSGMIAGDLVSLFGPDAVDDRGAANKAYIRNIVFNDESARRELESLIHPVLKQECLAEIASARHNRRVRGFIVDAPLYYESAFTCGEDAVCVVALSQETQRTRLAQRNHFSPQLIESIISAQWPIFKKVALADIVLWNEGPRKLLKQQTERFYLHYIS